MQRKLYTLWWLVLLRSLVEAGLIAPYFVATLQEPGPLALLVAAVTLVGGLLEIGMVIWMRGHYFRGILRFIGAASVLVGGLLLWAYPPTIGFLLVITGLWLVVRGFGVFWLGLSIIERPLDRAVPVLSGLVAIGLGIAAMLWLDPEMETYLLLVGGVGLASSLMHLVISLRLRADRRRALSEEEQVAE